MGFYLANFAGILAGFALMIGGSYLLVFGASNVAGRWGISEMVIGATVVALGTSLPELITVVIASAQGKHDIGLGNVAGSNILNVLAILGVAALILPIHVNRQEVSTTTLIFLVAATLYLLGCLLFRKQIGRADGLLLVASFAFYSFLSYQK